MIGLTSCCTFTMELPYLEAIWLFTRSDMKTIVFPQSIFGITTAFAACTLHQPFIQYNALDWFMIRYPLALIWTWLNLLPFNIFNQLSNAAINEDRINKPWRPLPSNRISQKQAASLIWYIGGFRQSTFLLILGIWYNVGGGADNDFLMRNIINAMGILSFGTGATEVALGSQLLMKRPLIQWIGILASVISFTVQTQDLGDVEGDARRGRRTMPITIGDTNTRRLTVLFILGFSVLCPVYWSLSWHIIASLLLFGASISSRMMIYHTPEDDKWTFLTWNIWLVCIYLLPLVRYMGFNCII
ncbi:UbiA prenyltransferase family-domain-containing protein [Xylaria sp. FL1042]|nr:UbiA prenyltransferase family-domain-containing protein [Xylaria sp. FL1042]